MRQVIAATILVLAGATAAAQAQQAPLPPLPNPPGDIPDSQAFVAYRSSLGFTIKAPEGWSRRERTDGVSFEDKYGAVAVAVTPAAAAPTVDSVKQAQAAALEATPAAVVVSKVAAVRRPDGPAVVIEFASNSEPNAVTGKAIRLENKQYLFWHAGRLATLTLSAPFGADNLDQWQMMAGSFQWN